MRLEKVVISNYRAARRVELHVDRYTALIGPNGAGKSSVLYALDWFFNGGSLVRGDVHETTSYPFDSSRCDVSVMVTFSDLNDLDRTCLGKYGRGTTCTFTRTWNAETKAEQMVGSTRRGPGFVEVESAGSITEVRARYNDLRDRFASLPKVQRKADIEQALADWESDPDNRSLLEDAGEEDASQMFVNNGGNGLSERIRYLLVPAAPDLSSEVGASNRGSALHGLIGGLLAPATQREVDVWSVNNREILEELSMNVKASVETTLGGQVERVNTLLDDLVPNAKLEISATLEDWKPRTDVAVHARVSLDGQAAEVERQGHGVQRALLIAMLQSLVPDQPIDDQQADTDEGGPALVVAIEEPEIFQHPIRARHFARVLADLGKRAGTQVMIATHSPYFLLPEQFESVRRCTLAIDGTRLSSTSVPLIAGECQVKEAVIKRAIEKEIPRTFAESFFAGAVILVEGDTDRVLLEALAERLGDSLDRRDLAVISVEGKGRFRVAKVMLDQLGVPTYVLADGDALSAERKYAGNQERMAEARASHKAATNDLVAWLRAPNDPPFEFGDDTLITSRWAVWQDDLEAELSQWLSFASELGDAMRTKDVAAYRCAAAAANTDDLPENLERLMREIIQFADAAGVSDLPRAPE